MPNLASHKYCTGCMACNDTCYHNAITVVEKKSYTICRNRYKQMRKLWFM